MAEQVNEKSTKEVSRRDFFRYSAAGLVTGSSLTYSPSSEAFAFTAAAIAAGEKIGWGAWPFMQSGRTILDNLYEQVTSISSGSIGNLIGGTSDMNNLASTELFNNRLFASVKPIRDNCHYDTLSRSALSQRDDSRILSDQFSSATNLNYAGHMNATFDVDYKAALEHLNRTNHNPINSSSASNVYRFYQHWAIFDVNNHKPVLNDAEEAAPALRRQLMTSYLNTHQADVLTDNFHSIRSKINTTYHDTAWRESLNGTVAEAALTEEYALQIATQNQLLFAQLIYEQRTVVLKALEICERMLSRS